MSYSFSFHANSKHEAMEKAAAEFERVVDAQTVHQHDQQQALDAVESFIDLVPDPDDSQAVYVTVSGSVSWQGVDQTEITGAGVNITVGVSAKPKA